MSDEFDAVNDDAGRALAESWPRAMLESSFRDATTHGRGEIALWRPRLASADTAVLRDGPTLRARARDLVRNNPLAKNAARMQRDAVSGSGLKLALKIDRHTLGLDVEAAAEWQDHVTRMWEAYADGIGFAADARRQLTFSQLFMVCDTADFVDGESIAVVEMKPSQLGYQTCLSLVDVDRLSTPDGTVDSTSMRAGVERDVFGEPIAYHIRETHPSDITLSMGQWAWKRVPRSTPWGRPIVLHSYDHARPEMTRGVSEFASAIAPMKMLQQYADTELQSAIAQAAVAAVIKSELDWSQAMTVLGRGVGSMGTGTGNPISDMVSGHMVQAAEYAKKREITFQGVEIPHLLPNESIEVIKPSHPNANFAGFESAFVRQLAAGLGVEAHELGKNYREVNYSSARAALLAVWRTYLTRRTRLVNQIAMPFFGAWLEEAVWLGTVPLPPRVVDFQAAKPFLVRGTFVAWGKPMIDPLKERQGQQLGIQMGSETLEDIAADSGKNWRDLVDQNAYERAYYRKSGVPHPADLIPPPMGTPPAGNDTQDTPA